MKRKIKGKTPAQWRANYQRMSWPPACEYGHYECSCSSSEGGPCASEMLALMENDEDQGSANKC